MKRSVTVLAIVMVLAFVFIGTAWAAEEEVQLTGTIMQGGLLVDDQGQEYVVAKEEGAPDLESQVGQKIEVKGTVMENSDGQKVIKINDYKVVE